MFLDSGAETIFKAFSLMIYPVMLVVDLCCARWLRAGCLSSRSSFSMRSMEATETPSSTISIISAPRFARPVEQRFCSRLEVQAVRAPIVRVARRSIRPLSASRSRRRVSVIGCRSSRSASSVLFETLIAINAHQDRPLGAGDAELPGLLVGIGLQQARYVHDCNGEFPWLWRHVLRSVLNSHIVSKLIICSTC